MDASLGLSMYFSATLARNEIAPLSRAELARKEQAYYARFCKPRASGTIWKTATAFLAPSFAAVAVAIGLLVYGMH